MFDDDIKLDPCRYCGGEAIITECDMSTEAERIVIQCQRCGIALDHTQEWYTIDSYNKFGALIPKRVLKRNMSAIEIWNGGMLDGKNSKM